jgi:hypothetical protein
MHCVLSICIYIEKEKKRRKKQDNNPNPRKLTLNIRTEYCFLPIKAPSSMFSYIEHIKRKVY